MDILAITIRAEHRLNRIITPVTVQQAEAYCVSKGLVIDPIEARALWDTGATGTCISARLAQYMKLDSVTSLYVTSVHGSKPSKIYPLDIILPDGIRIANVPVAEIDSEREFDIIIGMNIISLGDFAITNNSGKTVMSFRLPSANLPIDFSKEG
jgi:hypothetical protein